MSEAALIPMIVERFPVAEWAPNGPPHYAACNLGDKCTACGALYDRAVHSAEYWKRERGLTIATASEYVEWLEATK